MNLRTFLAGALAAPLLLAAASPPGGGASAWPEFDAKVAEAKASMMANTSAALAASEAALRIAQSKPPSRERTLASATGAWLKGEALIRLNRQKQAAPVIEAALQQARAVAPGAKLEGDLLKARGSVAALEGRVQPALIDFQAAFRVFQKADVPRSEAIVLQDIGSIYADARDYNRVVKYYEQANEIYNGDPAIVLTLHNNLGNAYRELGRYKDSLRESTTALELARKMDSPALTVRVLPNLAVTHTALGDYSAADAELREAFGIGGADPGAREWIQPYVWGAKAQLEAKRGRMTEARAALAKTFEGQDIAKTPLPYREFHETAWRVFSASGEPDKALAHLAAFKRLDDEARDLAASTNAALMSAEFDFANQDLKIARLRSAQLQKDVELARNRERAQRNLMVTLTSAAGVVLALLLFGFFAMRRSRNLIRSANQRLASTNGALERALKAKSQFLATTSHEIRTPLNGILGMTQVLLTDRNMPPSTRSRVELVHGAGETMKALVDDLLDMAKMETGRITVEKTAMDLPRLVDGVMTLWRAEAQRKGLTLTLDAPDLPRTIEEDEARLRQVLFNLMSNAIKFTEAGGVTLRIRRDDGRLVFEVVDTGCGIDAADHERVFEPFTQVDGGTARKHGGTGLGLPICRDVTHALGGEVRLTSALSAGSTFAVALPLVEPDAAVATDAAKLAASRPLCLADARMLIVEPNPLARSVLRAVLQAETAQAVAVADLVAAREALQADGADHLLIAGEALGADPAAAVEAVHAIAELAPGAELTLLLTAAAPELQAALMRAGVRQVLARPLPSGDLLAALRAVHVAAEPDEAAPAPLTAAAA